MTKVQHRILLVHASRLETEFGIEVEIAQFQPGHVSLHVLDPQGIRLSDLSIATDNAKTARSFLFGVESMCYLMARSCPSPWVPR